MGGWMDPRAVVDAFKYRKALAPSGNWNLGIGMLWHMAVPVAPAQINIVFMHCVLSLLWERHNVMVKEAHLNVRLIIMIY